MSEPPSPPLRTWRPMAAWTAGMLLALGLAWFVAAVMVPWWQVRDVLGRESAAMAYPYSNETIAELGGADSAARKAGTYLRMPKVLAPERIRASFLLIACLKSGSSYAGVPLSRLLADPDPKVRGSVAWALGDIDADAAPVLPALVRLLADSDSANRHVAARALRRMGPAAGPAVPALTQSLSDGVPEVRMQAAMALMAIGPTSEPAALQLAEALDDPDSAVRRWAAEALASIGPRARPAVPALTRAMSDADAAVRRAATRALTEIRGEEPKP